MAFSKTENEFEEHLRSAQASLENLTRRDATAEEELRKFADYRAHYATYKLMTIRGWRGLRSSTASEQNHSSVLSHLYDGNKKGNYYQSPETYIKDLFVRIDKKNNEFNERLSLEKLTLDLELRKLLEHNPDPNLISAAKELCLNSYKDFKNKYDDSTYYYCQPIEQADDEVTGVFSKRDSTKPPIIIPEVTHQCCMEMWKDNTQCRHHIAKYGFRKEVYESRHFRLDKVTGSLNGWSSMTRTNIAHVIEEDIGSTSTQGDDSNGHRLTGCKDKVVDDKNQILIRIQNYRN